MGLDSLNDMSGKPGKVGHINNAVNGWMKSPHFRPLRHESRRKDAKAMDRAWRYEVLNQQQ